MITPDLTSYFQSFPLPRPDSHKGQNGKVLLIGGSELFHAASKWSLDILSKCVDMVFYASVPSNNRLIEEAKGQFWNGIVIPRQEIENYIAEADCILIGPGMTRERHVADDWLTHLTPDFDWDTDTYAVTNYLLATYPDKKWVIDAGALQMVEPQFLNQHMIITPHRQELLRLVAQAQSRGLLSDDEAPVESWLDVLSGAEAERQDQAGESADAAAARALNIVQKLNHATWLIKGKKDLVLDADRWQVVSGGNAGMTKGGTGDVLAGLVAALYARHSAFESAVMASYVNKQAGDHLFTQVGPFFNASDLVTEIPKILWEELSSSDAVHSA